MRTVKSKGNFKSDLKRESKGKYREILKPEGELDGIINALANDFPLDYVYHDHKLTGKFKNCRECHIRPDFLLIYRYDGDDVLILEGLGSHSEVLGL